MISKEEVKNIAKLARIGISEAEIERFRKDLSSVLGYVEKLKEVDVSDVLPTSHPFEIENVMRTDEAAKEKKKLLEGFLKVKSILK